MRRHIYLTDEILPANLEPMNSPALMLPQQTTRKLRSPRKKKTPEIGLSQRHVELFTRLDPHAFPGSRAGLLQKVSADGAFNPSD